MGANFTESTGILPVFPWGGMMQSQGLHHSAGTHWRLPAAGWTANLKAVNTVESTPTSTQREAKGIGERSRSL